MMQLFQPLSYEAPPHRDSLFKALPSSQCIVVPINELDVPPGRHFVTYPSDICCKACDQSAGTRALNP